MTVIIFLESAWIANNFEGSYKRGVSLAMAISMYALSYLLPWVFEQYVWTRGNLNGAVSSNVVRLPLYFDVNCVFKTP
jgi:hypothetical protein